MCEFVGVIVGLLYIRTFITCLSDSFLDAGRGVLPHRLQDPWGNTNRVVSNRVVSKGPLYPSKTKTVTLLMFAG